MAESAVNYKCPNCSAPLSYQPGKETITCEYCGTEFKTETIEELYLVDDDTAILHEELMVDLDKDLDDFLDKLLKD